MQALVRIQPNRFFCSGFRLFIRLLFRNTAILIQPDNKIAFANIKLVVQRIKRYSPVRIVNILRIFVVLAVKAAFLLLVMEYGTQVSVKSHVLSNNDLLIIGTD